MKGNAGCFYVIECNSETLEYSIQLRGDGI